MHSLFATVTKILRNLCLHFARQDGQDRKKNWKENPATKVTKIPKTKRRKYGKTETLVLNHCPIIKKDHHENLHVSIYICKVIKSFPTFIFQSNFDVGHCIYEGALGNKRIPLTLCLFFNDTMVLILHEEGILGLLLLQTHPVQYDLTFNAHCRTFYQTFLQAQN